MSPAVVHKPQSGFFTSGTFSDSTRHASAESLWTNGFDYLPGYVAHKLQRSVGFLGLQLRPQTAKWLESGFDKTCITRQKR
mmetsp:Transcript_11073/g.24859  ORF Transcript_11073/g.24859 Transcript_11073/m.24859 type:complete len:81 (+) Transcript_11073:1561-1803(+)